MLIIWDDFSLSQNTLTRALSKNSSKSSCFNSAKSERFEVAIHFRPLFLLMKLAAKRVMMQTAEKNGLHWKQRVREYRHTQEVLSCLPFSPSLETICFSVPLKPHHLSSLPAKLDLHHTSDSSISLMPKKQNKIHCSCHFENYLGP